MFFFTSKVMKNLQSDALQLKKNVLSMGINQLRLSVTNNCNASCAFCHNEGHKKGIKNFEGDGCKSSISLKEITNIADIFKDTIKKVKFTGGEPTLVNDLDKIIKIFHDRGYICSITTNGFIFDKNMQEKLRESGLTQVSVSIPSLSPEQHSNLFGQKEIKLNEVLKNIITIPEIFDSYKINFMASDETVPSQLIPMNDFGASTGIPISIMEFVNPSTLSHPMSKKIINYLKENVGLNSSMPNKGGHTKGTLYQFNNGGIWEADDFREVTHRKKVFDNDYCKQCDKTDRCVEGPYSLRIGKDLVVYPCLIRRDNGIRIKLEEPLQNVQ